MQLRTMALVGLLLLGSLAQPLRSSAQVAPARDDLTLPEAAQRIRASDPRAYSLQRAWIGVAERARRVREAAVAAGASARRVAGGAVSGNFSVPVFAVSFANTDSVAYPATSLETALFGPGPGTLTDYYSEISGGRVNVGGSVRGWTALSQADTYYEGTSNGLDPANAHVGELIRDTLDAWDASVDFGQYDNDGPDGVPNSGDDDGYVDFVAFVHPETGGECGPASGNIWSHRWRYTSWPASGGLPYMTDDPSAGGGTILVSDYVIQPGLACGGTQPIEIGVFCHEFGHAFGLPDLYETDGGGSAGLGHWCLMASGNWNSPDSPAHMSAWTKAQLGWVDVIDVDWQGTVIDVDPVQTSGLVYRLAFTDERFRRRAECALDSSISMVLGLDDAEAASRGWLGGRGYGNGWTETLAHDFHYDGNGPVTLSYDYAVDTEGGFDFVFVLLEKNGIETTLAVYDGKRSGHEVLDLTGYFTWEATDYRIKFRLRSDRAYSDEDGNFDSVCAPWVFDGFELAGGGENYTADFEQDGGGWYAPPTTVDNPVSEYWLVENRQALGYDLHLHGTGLMVYHVDDEVMNSWAGNNGGSANTLVRGVSVDEADGEGELLMTSGGNRGDAGDVWPGVAGKVDFDSQSVPAAIAHDGDSTRIAVHQIEVLGGVVRAQFFAGDPAPSVQAVSPTAVPADTSMVTLDLVGEEGIRHGATVRLVRSGLPDALADSVLWLDPEHVQATFTIAGHAAGLRDVVVENPDGQTAVVPDGFRLVDQFTAVDPTSPAPRGWALAQNYPNPFNPRTSIRFDVPRPGPAELAVFDLRGRRVVTLVDGPVEAGYHSVVWDGTDAQGRPLASGVYFARLRGDGFQRQRKMLLVR